MRPVPNVVLQARGHFFSLFKIYFTGILFFALFRLLIVCNNIPAVTHIHEDRAKLLLGAFFMGFRFDTVISCYILSLPVFIIGVCILFRWFRKPVLPIVYGYIGFMFAMAFLICAADVPFFSYFFERLNDTIFNWSGHAGFGFRMVWENPRFYLFFFVFIIVASAYLLVLKRIYKRHSDHWQNIYAAPACKQWLLLPFILVIWAATFLGIRGRLAQKTPIIPGAAYFSANPFINQMGLNPVFTLMRSLLDNMQPENERLQWMPDNKALQYMHQLYTGDNGNWSYSPLLRKAHNAAPLAGRNIVLVMMESMSANKMTRFGNPNRLTPFLDSLAAQNWSFDCTYSAGIHTYNGIYTTLFAHPALMKRHTMDQVSVPQMAGLPNLLYSKGYQTIFFTTHDELFDNMSGFLSANDVQTIVGQKDYPAAEVRSTLGVPDDFMFHYSIKKLNRLAENRKPFFAAFMTGSDHGPVVIPYDRGYVKQHEAPEQDVVSYADWSMGKFLQEASKQPWCSNTVFVFVADHGCYMDENPYDIAFSYHHIPFIIYAPGFTQPKAFDKLALQADVFPTVMGLVADDYANNSFGINLLKEDHKYIVFSADDKFACMNDSLLFIYRKHAAAPSLYKYRDYNTHDYYSEMHATADTMCTISWSWLQTSQWMLEHNRAGLNGANNN